MHISDDYFNDENYRNLCGVSYTSDLKHDYAAVCSSQTLFGMSHNCYCETLTPMKHSESVFVSL